MTTAIVSFLQSELSFFVMSFVEAAILVLLWIFHGNEAYSKFFIALGLSLLVVFNFLCIVLL